ncbi:hypothetical protein M595_0071 [Lyngbya aestuarii BL J]|uniref:Uncharacterized protein n=1 Tax=Lyngbya aestuarii BL J TaxID=1348334 RepID=U7QRC1_9CYAN|nr:hypothetical protein M595_0071 [Lyngbya aestuarii BL J]
MKGDLEDYLGLGSFFPQFSGVTQPVNSEVSGLSKPSQQVENAHSKKRELTIGYS